MKWSEIDSAFQDLRENLGDVGTRIETAIRNHGQIYHANHKPWYTKKIRLVQRRFLFLKRRLDKLSGIPTIFDKLDSQLRILREVSNEAQKLRDAHTQATLQLKSLGAAIRIRREAEFDIFATHRGEVSVDRTLCFVMMPFKPEKVFNPVYAAIRRGVVGRGLKCIRSDKELSAGAVIIKIWEKIRKSIVCIADISPPNNPNVFYEIGMAHSLPKRVILISRRLKSDEKFPFDVNYAECIFYDQTISGCKRLEQDISRTLRTILN